jgi:hypothetical protein
MSYGYNAMQFGWSPTCQRNIWLCLNNAAFWHRRLYDISITVFMYALFLCNLPWHWLLLFIVDFRLSLACVQSIGSGWFIIRVMSFVLSNWDDFPVISYRLTALRVHPTFSLIGSKRFYGDEAAEVWSRMSPLHVVPRLRMYGSLPSRLSSWRGP